MIDYTDAGDEVEINLGPFGHEILVHSTDGGWDGSCTVRLRLQDLNKMIKLLEGCNDN